MTVFAPVREAQRLWERTAPQLTLELDELPEATNGRSAHSPFTAERPPAAPFHDNAGSAQDLSGTRALPAKGA